MVLEWCFHRLVYPMPSVFAASHCPPAGLKKRASLCMALDRIFIGGALLFVLFDETALEMRLYAESGTAKPDEIPSRHSVASQCLMWPLKLYGMRRILLSRRPIAGFERVAFFNCPCRSYKMRRCTRTGSCRSPTSLSQSSILLLFFSFGYLEQASIDSVAEYCYGVVL